MTVMRRTIDVQDLIEWTYRTQAPELAVQLLAARAPRAAVSTGWLDYGTVIDGGGPTRADTHPDALIVHDAVSEHAPRPDLLVLHARAGTSPDWYPEGPGLLMADVDGRGRMLVRTADYRLERQASPQRGRRRAIACCLTIVGTDPALVEAGRETYALWRDGLGAVAAALAAAPEGLVAHEVRGPRAPRRPWESGGPVTAARRGRIERQNAQKNFAAKSAACMRL